MFSTPQKISLAYDGRQLWVEVWRFSTPTELHTALTNAGIKEFDKKTVVYSHRIEKGDHCGTIYLLDTSIEALARQAAVMAFHIGQREHIIDFVAEWEDVISHLIGVITSELYSKNKHW